MCLGFRSGQCSKMSISAYRGFEHPPSFLLLVFLSLFNWCPCLLDSVPEWWQQQALETANSGRERGYLSILSDLFQNQFPSQTTLVLDLN